MMTVDRTITRRNWRWKLMNQNMVKKAKNKQGQIALKVFANHTENRELALISCEILNYSYLHKSRDTSEYVYSLPYSKKG